MIMVAVTDLEYEKGKAVFDRSADHGFTCVSSPKDEKGLVETVRNHGARHVIVGDVHYRDALYEALGPGSVISRYGVGYDGLDLEKATARGILCTNTPGQLEISVAELAVAFMLASSRRVVEMNAATKEGSFHPNIGNELYGKRLAIIGCGHIGCRVATVAAKGFGMEVVGCDVRLTDEELYRREHGFCAMTNDFAEAVKDADFVSIHVPLTPETRHFLNTERIGMLPKKAWLINTARGPIVDEIALYDAVASGAIRGAALDVFETEPYEPAAPGRDLRTLPQVIMTPHAGSSTVEACNRVARRSLENIVLAEKGDFDGMNLLNPDAVGRL